MNAPRDRAVSLLDHYLCMIAEKAGMKVDSYMHAEIAQIVDEIINAVHVQMLQGFKERKS